MQCRVPACFKRTEGHSQYCSLHRQTHRRHGHPNQTGVTKTELRPYSKAVERFLDSRGAAAWDPQFTLWKTLVVESRRIIDLYNAGRPESRHDREAAACICRVAEEADPRDVVSRPRPIGSGATKRSGTRQAEDFGSSLE
jgi:hypothetical protein